MLVQSWLSMFVLILFCFPRKRYCWCTLQKRGILHVSIQGKPEGIVPAQANHPNEDLSKKLAIWFNGFARGSIMPGNPNLSTEVDRWLSGDSLVAPGAHQINCTVLWPPQVVAIKGGSNPWMWSQNACHSQDILTETWSCWRKGKKT